MITTLTKDTFDTAISDKTPILVDFWAEWCAPCMMQGKVLHALSEQYPALRIGKVNVDEYGELAQRFGIDSIPTMILFREGKLLETVVGLRQAQELLGLFQAHGAESYGQAE